jgi:hypothetical protein
MRTIDGFGCAVKGVAGFTSDPNGELKGFYTKDIYDGYFSVNIKEELNKILAAQRGQFTRTLLAVVTEKQKEALAILDANPRAHRIASIMNYANMNYIYMIHTDRYLGPGNSLKYIPFKEYVKFQKEKKRLKFQSKERSWKREG